MIRTIPLKKLLPSPRNVRRVTDEQADLQLKADIEARGLLQNLVVAPAAKRRGCFTVEAGGRRFGALKALAAEGKLPRDHGVACLVIEDDAAVAQEVSLAENFQRLSMNPADECLAFQQLIDQGADVEGIARRFGLTVRFVEGRLRLAGLAPVVFEALGAGEITLDIAKAYAASADRERQVWVFEQLGRSYAGDHPDSIRRMMTQASASASDPRARLVGEDAYVAAGGRVERDLFSEEVKARWLDVALLERLASAKMETLAAEAAASTGLGWVRPSLESWVSHSATQGLQRLALEPPALTEEETARVEALEAEMEQIGGELEQEELGEEERASAEARLEELGAQVEAIVDRPPTVSKEVKPRAGAFLLLDPQGRPKLDTTYYVEASEDPVPGEQLRGDAAGAAAAVEPASRGPSLSQALIDELAIHRRDVLAVHVAADPGLALDLAIFLMVDRDAGYSSEKAGSSLIAIPPTDPVFGFKTPDAPATIAKAEAVEALDRSWMGGATRGERFDAFRALSEDARAAWLGHAVARTLEASVNLPGGRACAFHEHLGRLLGIDVARWWRPTGLNFFDRVPKSISLSTLEEVGGPELAARYSKAKKAEVSQACERIFSGDFIGEAEVKERAVAWVPEAMRFAAATVPASAPAGPDDIPPWEELPKAPGAEGVTDGANGSCLAADVVPVEESLATPDGGAGGPAESGGSSGEGGAGEAPLDEAA